MISWPRAPPYKVPMPSSAMRRKVRARSGLLNQSPAAGAWPPGRKVAAAPSFRRSTSAVLPQSRAMMGVTGKPSSAMRMAGWRTSGSPMLP